MLKKFLPFAIVAMFACHAFTDVRKLTLADIGPPEPKRWLYISEGSSASLADDPSCVLDRAR